MPLSRAPPGTKARYLLPISLPGLRAHGPRPPPPFSRLRPPPPAHKPSGYARLPSARQHMYKDRAVRLSCTGTPPSRNAGLVPLLPPRPAPRRRAASGPGVGAGPAVAWSSTEPGLLSCLALPYKIMAHLVLWTVDLAMRRRARLARPGLLGPDDGPVGRRLHGRSSRAAMQPGVLGQPHTRTAAGAQDHAAQKQSAASHRTKDGTGE